MKSITKEEQEVDKQLFAEENQEELHPDLNRFSVLQIIGKKSKESRTYEKMLQYSGLKKELNELLFLLNMRDDA